MFTMKYEPNKWMMTISFNTGNKDMAMDWQYGNSRIEKYGPFDSQEDAWTLYYTLKAEDEYATIRANPYFEQVAAPPSISVKQKFAAAKYVMRNPQLEYWRPQREAFPVESKDQLVHRADISNYILESVADDMTNEIAQHKTKPAHHPACGCNQCYVTYYYRSV